MRRILANVLIFALAAVVSSISVAGAQEPQSGPAPSSAPLGRGGPDQPFGPALPPELNSSTPLSHSGRILTEPAQPRIPPYYLTNVNLTGNVVGDRASIDAEIEVAVNGDGGWHRVPLRLNQAHVWDHEYEGPGEEAPEVEGTTAEEGIVWLFRGAGLHRLKLSLWVPIHRSLVGRRLQLALPPLPPQFEATLKLSIPDAPISIRLPKETTLLESETGDNSTEILASVAGGRLDLLWQSATGNESTASQVLSTMNLRRNGNRIGLSVEQVIQFDQKSPRQLRIRLPKDFQLIDVSGTNYQEYTQDSEDSEWFTVHFDEILTDRTDLRWLLEADLPAGGRNLTLEGFEVKGAPRQDGVIRIEDFGLFDVRARSDRSQLVQRAGIDALSARGGSPGTSLSAFSFPKQPFRLSLDLTPIVPSFTVSPEHDLYVHVKNLEMRSRFRIEVDAGAVQQLALQWPYPAGEWVIDSVLLRVGTDEVPVSFTQMAMSKLELALPAALTGAFEIDVVAERTFNPDMVAEIRLPKTEAKYRGATRVRVFADDQLQTTVRSIPENAFVEVPAADKTLSSSGELPQQQLSSSGREGSLQVEATVHQRTVRAKTALHVEELTAKSLVLSQRVDLDIEYGRIGYVVLAVPDGLRQLVPEAGWEFAFDVFADGLRLNTQRVPEGLLATFPEARKGAVALEISYRYPLTGDDVPVDGSRRHLDVPLIGIQGAEPTGLRCQVHPLESVQIEDQAAWAAVQTSPDGAIWVAEQTNIDSVPLTISSSFADETQQYSVEQAFLQTSVAENGQMTTKAAFRLGSPPSHVVMRVPRDTELDEVRVNNETLPRELILRQAISGNDEDSVTIPLDGATSQTCILSISFHSQLDSEFGLSEWIDARFPYFPSGVWTEETLWQVDLPLSHHLFQSPKGLVPEFRWIRSGIVWRRTPTDDFLGERKKWSDLAPSISAQHGENSYSFRQFGPMNRVQLRSMNKLLIRLAGAGTMFLLVFLFWRLPWMRNIFSLVALAFLFSVASLWYLEPMLVMLQPAVFGVLMALLATALDAARHPERLVPVSPGSSVTPPGEDAGREKMGSSVTHIPTTIYRPTQPSDSASAQR